MDQADLRAALRRNPLRRSLLRARSQRPVRAQRDRQVHARGCHACRPPAAARRNGRPRLRGLAYRSTPAGETDVRDRATAHLARSQELRQGVGWIELPGLLAGWNHIHSGCQGTGGGRPDSRSSSVGSAGTRRQGGPQGVLRVVSGDHPAGRSTRRRRRARPQSRRRLRRIRERTADRRAAGACPGPGVPRRRGPHPAARRRGVHEHRATGPASRISMDKPSRPAPGRRPAPNRDSRSRYRE